MIRNVFVALAVSLLIGCGIFGAGDDVSSRPANTAAPSLATPSAGNAEAAPESGPAPGSGPAISLTIAPVPAALAPYDRGDWRHWIDVDSDCQNTRHEVLIEESTSPVTFTDARQCTVATGNWDAPYTGVVVTSARSLDVDHMVPLANAHKSGGWTWSAERKRDYANSMEYEDHLIAVSASANRSKGAKGPEEWRPNDESYWCEYAVDWITIKSTWQLTVTEAEWDALDEMLDSCESRPNVTTQLGEDTS